MTADHEEDEYDEFSLLSENAAELGLANATLPRVRRIAQQGVSAIQWGEGVPNIVLLHGGGQNAHTWDTVLLALGRPALAVDLPGHGHSDWRADGDYSPQRAAVAVAAMVAAHAASPVLLIGMSLGGLTAISLTAQLPELVRALVLVDVSPQSGARGSVLTAEQRGAVALTSGPKTFASFEEMVGAAVQAAPGRSVASLRRGVRHNAVVQPDGQWRWRYDRVRSATDPTLGWDEVSAIDVPVTLVRGALSSFVHEEDVAELRRRQPALDVHVIEGSGHSVQSDQPLALVRILDRLA